MKHKLESRLPGEISITSDKQITPPLWQKEGGGNGTPLQYSCLENPRDGGAWWAAVYGVAQSWTRLKQLSSSSSSMAEREEKLEFLDESERGE